jgi:hypothetical protein
MPGTLHGFSLLHLWPSESATTFTPPVAAPLGSTHRTEMMSEFLWGPTPSLLAKQPTKLAMVRSPDIVQLPSGDVLNLELARVIGDTEAKHQSAASLAEPHKLPFVFKTY